MSDNKNLDDLRKKVEELEKKLIDKNEVNLAVGNIWEAIDEIRDHLGLPKKLKQKKTI